MINFRNGISLIATQLIPLFANAQQADSTIVAKPVDPYSFELADSMVRNRKYERAVWTYINLYPRNPDSVVVLVRRLRPKIWEGDLPGFVQTTFARFAPMDPVIGTFDFDGIKLDSTQLRIKANWSDSLSRRVLAQ